MGKPVTSKVARAATTALNTKVNLPSGGYLYIQTTEALTVIDVNSGKFVSSNTQDETIIKTNIEAVHEIARQLRLRNIGGMVIVDFIDMTNRRDKLALMEELEVEFEKDKAKPQVGQLSDLGLVELTRHRTGQSLSEIFGKKCPHCQGSGAQVEEIVLSAPVIEGEIKAKAAKLKIPAQQIKNKMPNYKQNKVFNNPNNNPMLENNNQQNKTNVDNTNKQVENNTPVLAPISSEIEANKPLLTPTEVATNTPQITQQNTMTPSANDQADKVSEAIIPREPTPAITATEPVSQPISQPVSQQTEGHPPPAPPLVVQLSQYHQLNLLHLNILQ